MEEYKDDNTCPMRSNEEEIEVTKKDSPCIHLSDDSSPQVKIVWFEREGSDDKGLLTHAARVMGVPDDSVRCFSLPGGKPLGCALHMYIDLEAKAKGLAHNTNATQVWLGLNLPYEPPALLPDSIHGPALITADSVPSEEFADLGLAEWTSIKDIVQCAVPEAIFLG